MDCISFRSHTEFEQRGRSKRRKKNKIKRNISGSRSINSNGRRKNFCNFCNPTLSHRIDDNFYFNEDIRLKMLTLKY